VSVVSVKLRLTAAIILACNVLAQSLHAATTYSYDSLHRLTRVDYGNGTTIAYTYDAAGNRLTLVSDNHMAAVTVKVNPVNGGCVTGNGTYTIGSNIQLSAIASDYWYFTGWDDGIATNSRTITVPTNDATYTANFAAIMVGNGPPSTATPEWWLASYYGPTDFEAANTNDTDGDSMPAWAEYIAGTDPTNSRSVFRASGSVAPGGGFVVRWLSVSNRLYDLSRATNLLEGTNAFILLPDGTNMPATPPENSHTDRVEGVGPYFYRLDVHQ